MPKISEGTFALGGLAAIAIWIVVVLPFLYGPPPRFAEAGSPPQTQSEQAEQQATTKPDGSHSAPFFIRIPKTAKEEAQEAAVRAEKTSTDRWLMIFTGAVALFTLLLVGATVMLYRAGERQLGVAKESLTKLERAFVTMAGFGPMAHAASPADKTIWAWSFIPHWENTGNTATKFFVSHINYIACNSIFLQKGFIFGGLKRAENELE